MEQEGLKLIAMAIAAGFGAIGPGIGIGIEEMMMWKDIRIVKYPTRFNRDLPEKTMIDQYFERIVDGRSRHRPAFGIQLLVKLFCQNVLLTLKQQIGDLYAIKSR